MHRRFFLAALVFVAFVAAPLWAAEATFVYLIRGQIDAPHLLAPPPARGSAEDAADLETVFRVYSARTPAEEAHGRDENKLTIFHFAPAIGSWFVAGKLPKTEALFKQVEAEAKGVTDDAKNFFQRPRPYHVAPDRFPHSIEHEDPTHYSYPSGHSTRATVFAGLLAELLPDRREAILATGRECGWLRVLGGVHYPTDIYAGRVLGQAIVRELLRNPAFQRDFAGVQAELAAVAAATAPVPSLR
jgi:acid phosphatase (class A)